MLRRLPNLLSLLRIGLAAAFPFVEPAGWRLAVVVAAGASDWLDGYIARRFELRTQRGALLDGAADKLFVLSVLLTMTLKGSLAWWWMLAVIARDLAVASVAAYVAAQRRWEEFRRLIPRPAGKITTALQFVLFVALIAWPGTALAITVLAVTAATSVVAGIDYLAQFTRALRTSD